MAKKKMSWDSIKGGVVNGVNGYLNDRLRNGDYSVGDAVVADLASLILDADIVGMCNFNDRMYMLMNRLMQVNINEKNIRFYSNGNNSHRFGQSDLLDAEIPRYSYAEGLNYLNTTDEIRNEEYIGVSSTQEHFNDYKDNKNIAPKGFDHGNLYPDDLDALGGNYQNKAWRLGNPDSILYKTKKMFWQGKMNTIISRFGTNSDGLNNALDYKGIKSTRYGESHGRNLLKAGAEKRGTKYVLNGYNNPYCRVWTHHYQYDRYYKDIRPFYTEDNQGNVTKKGVKEFHDWVGSGFEQPMTEKFGYGWKNGDNGWEKSVLDTTKGGDGLVKIAPKYINGAKSNIHTKDCMFSIENLAWRGYDPYSFEKALSWEQRGPLGGRIMWFPPYGIEFNETTSVNWASSSFIGRGEDVYTYVNTQRSGTLSFLMVVDHPSVIDYASWHDENETFRDTDMLRFFAGCDSLDPNDSDSIMSIVKPTPLTDEYLMNYVEPEYAHPTVTPPPVKREDPTDEIVTVTFYVFYPNNYSGKYDNAGYAVTYLLSGDGAGMSDDGYVSREYDFKDVGGTDNNGYEMWENGLSGKAVNGEEGNTDEKVSQGNYIYNFAESYELISNRKNKANYRWFYRVDGEYSGTDATYGNTYGQKLLNTAGKIDEPQIKYDSNGKIDFTNTNTNYMDYVSYNLNSTTINWKAGWKEENTPEKIFCSFREFACAVAQFKGYDSSANYLKGGEEFEQYNQKIILSEGEEETLLIDHIETLLNKYKIVKLEGMGFSNSHGYNQNESINATRNKLLSENRINTIANWLRGEGITVDDVSISDKPGVADGVEPHENSGFNAKLWRSAKITITFKTDNTEIIAKNNEWYENEMKNYHKYVGYSEEVERDGKKLYKDENGVMWRELDDGTLVRDDVGKMTGVTGNMRGRSQAQFASPSPNDANAFGKRYYTDDKIRMKLNVGGKLINANGQTLGAGDRNTLRYDQEYYFFRTLEKKDPHVFNKLMDKIKYFDPAFHSMTPEGFNARLTFLNQCTRQGNTVSMSDINGKTANNLAFGRPPFCVLRLGDFYNQMIVIDSINIDYSVSDGIQWDMNTEGIGMQPLLARVSMSFKFIGGSDIAGPIRRLQNAMSFNYYANARFYDNRADHVRYKSEDNYKEIGGGDHNYDVDRENSWAYITNMYGDEKYSEDYIKLNAHQADVSPEMPMPPTPEPINLSGVNINTQTNE